MMFKTKGGGVKGFLNNVQKNCGSGGGWLPLSLHPTCLGLILVDVYFGCIAQFENSFLYLDICVLFVFKISVARRNIFV